MPSREQARRLIDRLVDAYNAHDTDALVALYDPDVTYWSALGGTKKGIEEVRAQIDELHATLPDEQMEARTVITDGEVIVVEFESTGTSPAGKPYAIEFTEVFELRDGKIGSIKVYLDPLEVEAALS